VSACVGTVVCATLNGLRFSILMHLFFIMYRDLYILCIYLGRPASIAVDIYGYGTLWVLCCSNCCRCRRRDRETWQVRVLHVVCILCILGAALAGKLVWPADR